MTKMHTSTEKSKTTLTKSTQIFVPKHLKIKQSASDQEQMDKSPETSISPFKALDLAATVLGDQHTGQVLRRSVLKFLTKLDTEKSDGVRKEYTRLLGESLRLAFGVGSGELKPQ